MPENTRCNLCGATENRVRFYKAPYTRLECAQCGLVWSREQPDLDALTAIYGETYFQGETYLEYTRDQRVIELNARRRLEAIHQFAQPPGLALDIGCATGFFLNVCREDGWQVRGVELSPYAAAYARDRLGLDVQTGTLETAEFSPESARLVTLWDVIEHVPDPMATLRQAAQLLQPGGLLALSTGNIEAWISRLLRSRWRLITYDHLYYFSPQTIRQYLETCGLQVVEINHPGRLVSPELVGHMLLQHYLPIARLRRPLMTLMEKLPTLSLNFWDVMTVHAIKPGG